MELPIRPTFWRSPLRGPWLASFLGSALLPLIAICAFTGFLSHAAYDPDLGQNAVTPGGGLGVDLYFFDWPTRPAWLYAVTQGLHVGAGLAAIPILLAKLWAVIPKLFEWPALRSPAHALERLSLLLLVGGSLFVFFSGVWNIQIWFPYGFPFVPAHYFGAFAFLGALGLHLVLKAGVVLRAFREAGVVRPLRDDLASTRPEPPASGHTTRPVAPSDPTISRRGLIATVGGASFALAVMSAGQSVGGPLRKLALLAPHGRDPGSGPNGFQVNKTAASVEVTDAMTGPDWRLTVRGPSELSLSREELLGLPQQTETLTIACVEGWSTTQEWTGVRLRDLAVMAGVGEPGELHVESLQGTGAFRQATLNPGQAADPRSLLALRVNGADLSLDHGFPARIIVPNLPGVHNTKWVERLEFA